MGGRHLKGALVVVALCAALIAPASAGTLNRINFSPAGSMTVKRDGPAAAGLQDGRVLIVGGTDGTTNLDTAEIFDPASGTFSSAGVGAMGSKRYGPVAVTLRDGRVLVAGGQSGATLDTAEVLNPVTGSFTPVGSMTAARRFAGAALLRDGRVLVAGGDSNNGPVLASAEIFNPATNSFSSAGAMTVPRKGAAAAPLSDGRVLMAGGDSGSGYLDTAEIFTPATGAFSPVGPMSRKRYAPAGAQLPGGRALVAGGFPGMGPTDLIGAEIFNAKTNKFSSAGIGPLGAAREEAAAAPLLDGRVLVVGGYSIGALPHELSSAELLSVPSNAFRARLKGRTVSVRVTNRGTVSLADPGSKSATSAEKKKTKLVKPTRKHGGPRPITVKIKLTSAGEAKLAQKGKLKIAVTFTPDGGLAKTKTLKLKK